MDSFSSLQLWFVIETVFLQIKTSFCGKTDKCDSLNLVFLCEIFNTLIDHFETNSSVFPFILHNSKLACVWMFLFCSCYVILLRWKPADSHSPAHLHKCQGMNVQTFTCAHLCQHMRMPTHAPFLTHPHTPEEKEKKHSPIDKKRSQSSQLCDILDEKTISLIRSLSLTAKTNR